MLAPRLTVSSQDEPTVNLELPRSVSLRFCFKDTDALALKKTAECQSVIAALLMEIKERFFEQNRTNVIAGRPAASIRQCIILILSLLLTFVVLRQYLQTVSFLPPIDSPHMRAIIQLNFGTNRVDISFAQTVRTLWLRNLATSV